MSTLCHVLLCGAAQLVRTHGCLVVQWVAPCYPLYAARQVSVAESMLVRNVLRPVTVPLKLWATWHVVRSAKVA